MLVSSGDHAPCVPPGAALPVEALNAEIALGGTVDAVGVGAVALCGAGVGIVDAVGGAGVGVPLVAGAGVVLVGAA